MPGLEQVYLRQAGTGSAALLGQSSWDPVAFAKYSTGLKAAQEAAQDQKKQKTKDALLKDLAIKPSKGIAEDRNYINNFGDAFMQYKANNLLKEGREINQSDYNQAVQFKQEWDQLEQDSELQDKALTGYLGQLKGSQGKLDNDAMMENGAKYSNPELFIDDDPYIKETFTPVLEYYMKDDFYGQDPERALVRAKAHWRNDDGRQYITEPLLSDVSLMEDYKANVLPLVSENKQHVGKTLSDGTYISEEYAYKVPYDTIVETKDGEKITLKGTRSAAELRFDDSPMIQKSATNRFNRLDETTKEDYVDQYGEDAAKQWYVDTHSPFGTEFSSDKSTRKAAGNTYSVNGQNYTSEYNFTPFSDKTNLQRESDPDLNVGGEANIDGYTITTEKGGKGQTLTLAGITPQVMYRQSNSAQVPIPNGYTITLNNTKVQRMATTNGLTWQDLANAETYDGKNVLEEFGKKFPKYKDAKKVGDISHITLTNDEADFLADNGLGYKIEDQYYVTGQADFYRAGKKDTDISTHYSDALIPLDEVMAAKMQGVLGLPINKKLEQDYPKRDWSRGYNPKKNPVKKTVNPKVNVDPNSDIKEKVKTTEGTPELD